MILHHDLSDRNILVDDNGVLTAVVDWECVGALPLWFACDYPHFICSKEEETMPIKDEWIHQNENGEYEDNELYWERLAEYEKTQLRHLFLDEMQRLQPRWVEIYKSSQRLRDIELAVSGCDETLELRRIQCWLDDLDSGAENVRSLEDRTVNDDL
ncbi:hypothetical protein F5B20DRAFT_541271 [Whalleya microplaca]|nr:hypothetical protein F5B20DRAFT_541271 [Whalleya microplaca]